MRRTLRDIPYYPSPSEILEDILNNHWPYKRKDTKQFYIIRDRALISILYLLGLRISEALGLIRKQFIFPDEEGGKPNAIYVRSIELKKSRVKGRPRRIRFRDGYLPLTGERAKLTELVVQYLKLLRPDQKLFPFTRQRAWQIITAMTPHTCHWFRAFCEDYLYEKWSRDLLAVADYVKVDPRTLQEYIRKRYEKYPIV